MAQIIDGLCDFDNVTADMIARHNMSMYGTGDYVLQIDECLEYDLVSNNEIHVKDGMYIMQGRRGCVKKGTTDICIIENGAQAVNRNDIIVIEYAKDEATRLESHTTKVIKGVPAEVAVDPEIVTGDINAGAVLHQMPLYRVKIEGLNVVAVEQMFEIGSVAAETVNPMEATEEGFAADAYKTKLQFDEQNKNFAKLEWTLLQSVTGNSKEIILPEQFNELQVQMVGSDMTYVWNLYKHNLKSTDIRLIQGYAGTTNPNYASFYANNNRIKIDAFVEKNVSKTNSAVTTVWYR